MSPYIVYISSKKLLVQILERNPVEILWWSRKNAKRYWMNPFCIKLRVIIYLLHLFNIYTSMLRVHICKYGCNIHKYYSSHINVFSDWLTSRIHQAMYTPTAVYIKRLFTRIAHWKSFNTNLFNIADYIPLRVLQCLNPSCL